MRYYIIEHATCRGLVAAESIPIGSNVQEITREEYEACMEQIRQQDQEDLLPDVPDGMTAEDVYTRSELTIKIKELEEQNELLKNCLLEMSELVYG